MEEQVVLGIDIGGTNTKMGIVTKTKTLVETSIPTFSEKPFDNFVRRVVDTYNELLEAHGKDLTLKGVGIGAPNGNYYSGTIEEAPNLRWGKSVPIASVLKKELGVPVFLTNDANAAAVGEKIFGHAKTMKDFVVITLGTGLGSGLFVNGSLVYGHDGFAGEIGHTTVFLDGRYHTTGRRGSLETYVSAPGIVRTVQELLASQIDASELRNIPFNQLDAKHITKAAQNGDTIALKAFDYTGKILGLKLSDTIAHLSPEAIILFGGLANAGDLLIKPTKKYMEEYNLNIYRNKVKLLVSDLQGSNVAILGAAALAWIELEKL